MAELGKIEKPESAQFAGKRKLCLVPLVFCPKNAPLEYVEKFNRYWKEVAQHIANLESKVGKTSVIFCESLAQGGEEGLKTLERLNAECFNLVSAEIKAGAKLEATEDEELTKETIDWERCLIMGLISSKVARIAADNYFGAMRKRYEFIANRIHETMKPDQVGLLFIQEDHMVQFPPDIEVFTVAPPALDEIRRWARDEQQKARAAESAENIEG